MNIKFGMNNFYTRYLKRFLNSEYRQSSNILGEFNKDDLDALIKYLDLPNTETIFEVQKNLNYKFPELHTMFNMTLEDDKIIFKSKSITKEIAEFIQNNYNDINDYCLTMGWKVNNINSWYDNNMDINNDGHIDETDRAILSDIVSNGTIYPEDIMTKADINLDGFINYKDLQILDDYMNQYKLYITVISEGRENKFPNEDMKIFVNQFTGDFLYNYAIRDANGEGTDDVVHRVSGNDYRYKIGLFKCKPRSEINYCT